MNLTAVMAEVGLALATLPEPVKVYVGAPADVKAPELGAAFIVPLPTSITYDATYDRGMDTIAGQILALLPRPSEQATHVRMAKYASGSGADSVKARLEAYTWTTCDGLTCTSAEFDVFEYATVPYLAILFTLEIWGSGDA